MKIKSHSTLAFTMLASIGLFLSSFIAHAQFPAPMIPVENMQQVGASTYAIPDAGVLGAPNVGIVIGEDATLIIDPGLGGANGELVLREAQKLSDNTKFYLATTHFHPEHTSGYVGLPEDTLYINARVQEQEFDENGETFVKFFADRSPAWAELLADFERRPADILFDREYNLDLGGVTVQFLTVGPTHTRGDTVFFVVEDDVLFTGDVVMNDSFLMAMQDASTNAWLKAFDDMEPWQPEVIIPAHGPFGDGSLIDMQRKLVMQIRDMAVDLKAEGENKEDTGAQVQDEMQKMYPDWPRAQGVSSLAQSSWQEAQ